MNHKSNVNRKPHYYTPFTSKPNACHTHIKILEILCDYQNRLCYFPTRREILMKLYNWTEEQAAARPSQMSTIFSNLVYHKLLSYDENFRYHITAKGVERTIAAYYNKD